MYVFILTVRVKYGPCLNHMDYANIQVAQPPIITCRYILNVGSFMSSSKTYDDSMCDAAMQQLGIKISWSYNDMDSQDYKRQKFMFTKLIDQCSQCTMHQNIALTEMFVTLIIRLHGLFAALISSCTNQFAILKIREFLVAQRFDVLQYDLRIKSQSLLYHFSIMKLS